jgi:hypothetical protein
MKPTENPLRLVRSGIARVLVTSVAVLTVSAAEPGGRYARIVTLCALVFFVTAYWVATSMKLPEDIGGSRRFRLIVRWLLIFASGSVVLRLRPDDGTFWNPWLLAAGTMEAIQTVAFLVYLRHVLSSLGHGRLSRHGKLLIEVASAGYVLALFYMTTAIFAGFENPFEQVADGEEWFRPSAVSTFIPLVVVLTTMSIWNFVFLVRAYLALGREIHEAQQ